MTRAWVAALALGLAACAAKPGQSARPAPQVVVPSAQAEESPAPSDAGPRPEELPRRAEVPDRLRSCKAESTPEDRAVARTIFADGVTAFELGDYKKAAERFLLAYERSCAAPLLYNLGTALERLGETQEAIGVLELYLELNPTGSLVEEVRKRLDKLRAGP